MPRSKDNYVCNKLTQDERMQIYRWAGEGYTLREICKLTNQSRGTSSKLRIPGIENILSMPDAHKWVSKFRMEFLKNVKDIPIVEKRIRLDDLERLRKRLMFVINDCMVYKNNNEMNRFFSATNKLLMVLEAARTEMEPRAGGMTVGIGINGGRGDLGELSDTELQNQRADLIRRASIIIKQRTGEADGLTEGDAGAGEAGPAEVFLAAPEELRRDAVQGSAADVSDVRQPEGNDPGLSAV